MSKEFKPVELIMSEPGFGSELTWSLHPEAGTVELEWDSLTLNQLPDTYICRSRRLSKVFLQTINSRR